MCVCVCVFFSFILDVRLVDVPAEATQDFSPTFLLRCLPSIFSREEDSAVRFPAYRPWSRIMCTNELIVLQFLGI